MIQLPNFEIVIYYRVLSTDVPDTWYLYFFSDLGISTDVVSSPSADNNYSTLLTEAAYEMYLVTTTFTIW